MHLKSNALGGFLRAKREVTAPTTLPFRTSGHRRVPGLRRDEVAVTAGVSVEYYTRLEQGREANPSGPVVEALARVFDLQLDERRYLYRLTNQAVPTETGALGAVSPKLISMMDTWSASAAYVLNPRLDILAMNSLAEALFSAFTRRDNIARMVFCDPAARVFYPDWRRAAENTVAMLRLNSPLLSNDGQFEQLHSDLTEASREFADLWATYDVVPKTTNKKTLSHEQLGTFDIDFHAFEVSNEPGHQLVVYQTQPGSPLELAMRRMVRSAPATSQAPGNDEELDSTNRKEAGPQVS